MTTMSEMTVVVVGGAGYIGSVLCQLLLRHGHRVRVLDRAFFGIEPLASCATAGDRFTLVRVDSRDVKRGHLADADAVIDLAGLSNDPSCALDGGLTQSINVEGGMAVLEAARVAGVRRYIYQSSCSVYGASQGQPLDETAVPNPLSEYSRSKVTMEQAVLGANGQGFEVVVPRPGTVFGLSPRMRFDLIINTMTLAAHQDGKVLVHGGSQWRPLIHVRDVARALIMLLEAPAAVVAGGIFNVGDDRLNYRVGEIAGMVTDLVAGSSAVILQGDVDTRDYRCDFGRLARELGFRAETHPRQGIEEIVAALRAGQVDTGIRTRTVQYYAYLLDAKRVLDDLVLDGRLL
jgi:nucleoside-diphosphate-sugar epimerase